MIPVRNTGQTPARDVVMRAFGLQESYPIEREIVRQNWEATTPFTMDAMGPHSERGHTFIFPIKGRVKSLMEGGALCIFLRLQISYTTYAGARIDEPPSDWIIRSDDLAKKMATKMGEDHYAKEEAAQPSLPL